MGARSEWPEAKPPTQTKRKRNMHGLKQESEPVPGRLIERRAIKATTHTRRYCEYARVGGVGRGGFRLLGGLTRGGSLVVRPGPSGRRCGRAVEWMGRAHQTYPRFRFDFDFDANRNDFVHPGSCDEALGEACVFLCAAPREPGATWVSPCLGSPSAACPILPHCRGYQRPQGLRRSEGRPSTPMRSRTREQGGHAVKHVRLVSAADDRTLSRDRHDDRCSNCPILS